METPNLHEQVVNRYDPDYLVDILGITSEELVEAFYERVTPDRFPELDQPGT